MRQWFSDVADHIRISCTKFLEILACLIETGIVRSTIKIQVISLKFIILPETNRADDVVSSRLRFSMGQISAAQTRMTYFFFI